MSPIRLIVLLLCVALAATAVGAFGAWWLTSNYTARVPLRDQSLQATLPQDLPLRVEVLRAGGDAGVPVRLKETLRLHVDFDAQVPLQFEVRYRGEIPIKTRLPLNTEVKTRVLGIPMTLPIQGSIPLDLQLPVDLRIPIRQPVRLKFSAPLTARVDQVVHIPLRAELETRAHFTDATIPITVREAELELPLNQLSLTGPAPIGSGRWTFGPLAPAVDPPPEPAGE
jgi:hypothetical protein